MRRFLVAAVVAAAVGGLGTGTASAYCDPKYRPLCINDCGEPLPDPKDPDGLRKWLFPTCPD